MSRQVTCLLFLLAAAASTAAQGAGEGEGEGEGAVAGQQGDYLPRSIWPDEPSMAEAPPSADQPAASFASAWPRFLYRLQDELEVQDEPDRQPSREEMEKVLRKHFNSKSKYIFDKDQVGIPGKAKRFRRAAASTRVGAASTSSSSGSASASASSSSFSNDQPIFYDQGLAGFGFNGASFGDFGGLGSSHQGGSNFGASYDGGYGDTADDGLHSRFGSSDSSGSRVRGVFSGASSSIDSDGKVTHSVKTGRF